MTFDVSFVIHIEPVFVAKFVETAVLRVDVYKRQAYRLLPLDKDWRMVPLSEGLWFNGLSAGKYTLQAKLVFPDGKDCLLYTSFLLLLSCS